MTLERRKLGKMGLEVGVIGLGTEHLERKPKVLDAVLGVGTDVGVNYVDLLYIDPEYWKTFGPVYRAHRAKLVLAAHWGAGDRYDLDYCRQTFDHVLANVGNDRVEVAMMTMIDDGDRKGQAWREASLAELRRYQERGQVQLIGGSAHDPAIAAEAVASGLIDVLMFPINMLGHDSEPDQKLYRTCVEHGVSLVAMKAYHGGTLLSVNGQPSGITPAQCLQYVFSLPVSTAVPGPKTLAEWRATLHTIDLPAEEKNFRPVLGSLHDRLAGQCVYCQHCLPCPDGIEVGWIIWHVDQARGGDANQIREWYSGFKVKASECVECGICVERCPFGVDIMSKFKEAVALFETGVV